jgi:hypothetical protein
MTKVHELKTSPDYFRDVCLGVKKFEVRYNDRGFEVGDRLYLREFEERTQNYTGRVKHKQVTYLLDDPRFVKNGFVIMGIE